MLFELAAIKRELAELRERAELLQEASDKLCHAQARLMKAADPEAAAGDRAALENARRRLTEVQGFAERRAAVAIALDQAKREFESAAAEQARRVWLDADITRSANASAEAAASANRARLMFGAARGVAVSAREDAERAEPKAADAAATLRRQRDILSAVQQDAQRLCLENILTQAEAAQSDVERVLAYSPVGKIGYTWRLEK